MGYACKRNDYQYNEVARNDSDGWYRLRLEYAGERAQSNLGMVIKMKLFIRFIVISCFVYNMAFAGMLHTIIDLQRNLNEIRNREILVTPANVVQLSIRELSDVSI